MTGYTTNDSTLFRPPVELAAWAENHRHVLDHIDSALHQSESPLTEKQIWNLIARTYSREWADANAECQAAEQQIRILKSDDNMPLGLIGAALAGDTITQVKNAQLIALTNFTIIDEMLRMDDNLQILLQSLVQHQRTLEHSMGLTREVRAINDSFDDVAVAEKRTPSSINGVFGKFARKVLGVVQEPVIVAPALQKQSV